MKAKNIIITLIALLINCSVAYSQSLKHKVKDGETIASIAQKYGVTVDALKKKNPTLSVTFYSGMELIIPVKPTNNANSGNRANSNTNNNNNNTVNRTNGNTNEVVFGTRTRTTSTPDINEPARSTSSSSTSSSAAPANVNESGTEEEEAWTDYMGWYKNKTFSFSITSDMSNYSYLGLGLAVCTEKYGASAAQMGFGIKKRILLNDSFYVSAHVGPVVGLSYYTKVEFDDNYKEKNKDVYEFTYGLTAEVKAGIKLSDNFGITVGYFMGAPKFKFDNFFDNGSWMIGITTGF